MTWSRKFYKASEIEVFNAAEAWINYNFIDRKKHTIDVLMTVRLSLLSEHALKHILKQDLSFKKIEACRALINKSVEQHKKHKN